ncbi:hypothetical protein B0H15DRAFT_864714 [Mycena belliarum]|uniref:Glucose receptor Git3 N-terminal domain-containing protein n=1 Tax=Mycena belliarum TaxID=1033014 RepID=A0AAD6TSH7_9AGAR|nr:hypothetical protein B0H15DRAFT_864714 [Mycena belliae]
MNETVFTLPPFVTVYIPAQRNAVISQIVAGLVSLTALLSLLAAMIVMKKRYRHTHFQAYFVCLLLANTMQAWAVIMSLKWVEHGGVVDGPFCSAQGGIKMGGNLGTAVWSFVISLHLFNLLFLRYKTPKLISWGTVVFGWSFIFSLVFLGPVGIQTVARGPYFGIAGHSCWITVNYHLQQAFLEYFFEYFAVVVNFFLHIATFLRVRGNLLRVEGRWRVRWVPPGESWQLALGRDFTDSAMLRLARHMIWYPVAYAITIVPISVTRLSDFCGMALPLWADALTGCIFDLGGFINVVLFFGARHFFPEASSLPEFTEQRKCDVDKIVAQHGVEPFTLRCSVTDTELEQERETELREKELRENELRDAQSSPRRRTSQLSVNSVTPLTGNYF